MRPSTLLIFDLDNTLVHSQIDFQAIRRELIALLHAAGATAEPAEALRRLAIPELILLAEGHQGRQAGGEQPPEGNLRARCWQVVLRHEQVGMRAATVEPEVAAALALLGGRGYRLAVLTNNARPATEAVLRRFALLSHFELVVTRDDVAYLKPHPDGIERARAHFGGAVQQVFMIGDSYLDGLAALRAGTEFIAFRADRDGLAARGLAPRYTIQRLDELLELEL
ncbi:MAG: HAD family hydrolase [Chloroflexi bacterium]|nr:HAD family hydrolase [Chloroflexota bacterium]